MTREDQPPRPADARFYSPGWLDRLTDAVKRLPGPEWLYYATLLVVQVLSVNAVLWVNGRSPVGSITLFRFFFVFVAPYLLWVRSLLDRVAGRAFEAFRPALRIGDAEFARLRYELTTLPARDTRIVTGVAVVLGLWTIARLPASVIESYGASRAAVLITLGPLALFAIATAFVSTYQAIRQLRMVTRLHAMVTHIKVFHTRPLYAFSVLTAGTGISFLVLAYSFVAIRPEMALRTSVGRSLVVLLSLTAIACFALPLRGMQRLIAAEKSRRLAAATDRFMVVAGRLHQRVDEEILDDADKLSAQLSSLATERDALAKISTWPWDPAALTAFITTLVLPVLLFLLTHFLERSGF